MVNCHNLLAYFCELYNDEQVGMFLVAHFEGKTKALKSVFAMRCMMISISAKMVHDLQY